MKKLILTLSAALLCSLNAMAQQDTISRLIKIGTSYGLGNLQPSDSTNYIYHDTLGWDPVLSKWKCDTMVFLRGTSPGYVNRRRVSNKFDAQKRISEETFESFNLQGTVVSPHEKKSYTYTPQGMLATVETYRHDNGTWKLYEKATNTYNPQGKITDSIAEQPTAGGTMVNYRWSAMVYNASGQLESQTNYWHDGNNNTWKGNDRFRNYYTANKLTSTVFEFFDGSIWFQVDSTINTYDANGYLVEEEWQRVDAGGTWAGYANFLYAYDTKGNRVDSICQLAISAGGAYLNMQQTTTTYNSFNQPLIVQKNVWNSVANQFETSAEFRYYYEQIATSVKDVAVQAGNIRVYPIPASNTLTLDLNWKERQSATVMLFDMTGKVAGQWSVPAAKQHIQKLDITNIPSGTYMLKVAGTKGSISQQLNIVK